MRKVKVYDIIWRWNDPLDDTSNLPEEVIIKDFTEEQIDYLFDDKNEDDYEYNMMVVNWLHNKYGYYADSCMYEIVE